MEVNKMRYHLHRISFLFVFVTTLLLATSTFALASEQAWQVIVYEHANFQGKSLVYSVHPGMCQRLEPELSKYKMNDKLSSVKVGKNVAVRLFEHKNYSGQNLILSESVQSLSSYKFNDRVSSLVVNPKTMRSPVGVWLVHAKQSFRQTFYPASETCGGASYPHLEYNDDAESISRGTLPAGCQIKATIYEHADFKGKSQTFTMREGQTEPSSYEIGKDLLGKASSLKIEIIGKCPVRTQ
jgi:hypothetical protein